LVRPVIVVLLVVLALPCVARVESSELDHKVAPEGVEAAELFDTASTGDEVVA